jgi:hypothetical protein
VLSFLFQKSQCERTINSDELSLIKSQLKNMNIIRKAVELRLSILKEGSPEGSDWTDEGEGWQNYFLTPGVKLHSLSCQEILKNSVAMSYFLDYMNGVGGSNILLMYLNTSGEFYTVLRRFNHKLKRLIFTQALVSFYL